MAQTDSEIDAYWTYDASGEIDFVVPFDLYNDRFLEFLVVTDREQLALVDSGGGELWSLDDEFLPEVEAENGLLAPIIDVVPLTAELNEESIIALSTAGDIQLRRGVDGSLLWRTQLVSRPIHVSELDVAEQGNQILVATADGRLILLDLSSGASVWSANELVDWDLSAPTFLEVGDFDGDSADEIVIGYTSLTGFASIVSFNEGGDAIWSQAFPDEMELTGFSPIPPTLVGAESTLVFGFESGQVIGLSGQTGQRRWLRSMNRPITAMTTAELPDRQLGVLVATSVGTLAGFTAGGERVIDTELSTLGTESIFDLSGVSGLDPELIALDPPTTGIQGLALLPTFDLFGEVDSGRALVINRNGRTLFDVPVSPRPNTTQIVDVNSDGVLELLAVSFGTIRLQGLVLGGQGNDSYQAIWEYRLEDRPRVVLTVPDGLLVGTEAGRVVHVEAANGSPRVLNNYLGRTITHLAIRPSGESYDIIVGGVNTREEASVIDLITRDGSAIWSAPITLPEVVTALDSIDINGVGEEEILVGVESGRVISVSGGGRTLWESSVNGRNIKAFDQVIGSDRVPLILVATENGRVGLFNNKGDIEIETDLGSGIVEVWGMTQNGQDLVLAVLQNGRIVGLDIDLNPLEAWQYTVASVPIAAEIGGTNLFVSLSNGQLAQFSLTSDEPLELIWQSRLENNAPFLLWADLNRDVRPDLVLGSATGRITFATEFGQPIGDLFLDSGLVHIGRLSDGERPVLAIVTQNGRIQGRRPQPNRPPLISRPEIESDRERLSLRVNAFDLDRDAMTVSLFIRDATTGGWVPQGARQAARGNDVLLWVLNTAEYNSDFEYRLDYSDGTYIGRLAPRIAAINEPLAVFNDSAIILILFLLALSFVYIGFQLTNLQDIRGFRLYQRIVNTPSQTLHLLDTAYTSSRRSQEVLLSLSRRARRRQDNALVQLVDGLFFLADRPEAGLEVLISAIDFAEADDVQWQDAQVWRLLFKTGLNLLEVRSVLDVGQYLSDIEALIQSWQSRALPAETFEDLRPIIRYLRDHGRVTDIEDRLGYLQEGTVLIRRLQGELESTRPPTISNTIAARLLKRWTGLIQAQERDLSGRPFLKAVIPTRNIVHTAEEIAVGIQVENMGQATAKEVRIEIQSSGEFGVENSVRIIEELPVGVEEFILFYIVPHVRDGIRVAFDLTYTDANRQPHTFEFADRISFIPRDRPFAPIPNRYAPGTPLRPGNPLFVGRESLLSFLIESGGRPNQKNISILIGQRRTGKTSTLLRLTEMAPDDLLPVYIDCQSLGVEPGMPAFFYDLSWSISDALDARGILIDVPELEAWGSMPASRFTRQFLPHVFEKIPANSRLLFIFDEFEVFESLVDDQILPPNIFPFLRHLMQHVERLNFIFAGTHRLEEMSRDYWSILFNIALYRQISFLTEDSARRLITRPVDPYLSYDDLAVEKILRVTAGHPYFLQLVCYTLVNHANRNSVNYVTVTDVNLLLKEMLKLGEMHFVYLWQESTPAERAILVTAAHLFTAGRWMTPEDVYEALTRYEIRLTLEQLRDGFQRLVIRGIFKPHLDERVTHYQVRIGLVTMWVAENKSLSQLYDS